MFSKMIDATKTASTMTSANPAKVFMLIYLLFTIQPLPIDAFFRNDASAVTVAAGAFDAATTTSTNISRSVATSWAASATTASRSKSMPQLKPNVENVLEQQEKEFEKAQTAKTKQDDKRDSHGREQEDLVFEGEFEYKSDLLPLSTVSSPQELTKFFMEAKNRDLVIKGGGNPCDVIPPSDELYDSWRSNSKVVDSIPPNGQNEEILAVHSTVHLVPGLSIEAVSYTGCKVNTEPKSKLPFYEFTLVKEDYAPRGRKPMKFMFNKITGKGKGAHDASEDNNNPENSQTYALSRVSIQSERDGCRVCYYARVKVVSKLPKGMLRVIPLPKRTVENKVSNSIISQIEREGVASVNKFATALKEWVEKR